MVELVVVHDPPLLARPGLHHMAFFVEDLDVATRHLTQRGIELAMSAKAGETRFHFLDALRELRAARDSYQEALRLDPDSDIAGLERATVDAVIHVVEQKNGPPAQLGRLPAASRRFRGQGSRRLPRRRGS